MILIHSNLWRYYFIPSGFGSFGAKSVVSATVALDPGCMVFAQNVRVQSKAELINELILRDLLIVSLLC